MRFTAFFLSLIFLAGCASDDSRLQGTWRSNQAATVALAFQNDPQWENASPEKIQRFSDVFGDLSVTYSNGVATSDYQGKIETFGYKVVGRGSGYVIVQPDAGADRGRRIRIRFVDGGTAYWIQCGPGAHGLEEKFDKVYSP